MAELSVRERIRAGEWVDCWMCERVFARRRQTRRYCVQCGAGFCEGEHGHAWLKHLGLCLLCTLHEGPIQASPPQGPVGSAA